MSRLGWLLFGVGLLAACGPREDRERRGDEAYAQARYDEALTDYRAALDRSPSARLWAKTAAASWRTGALDSAAAAYVHLAEADPSRADEAADGLEQVARTAERAGNRGAVIGAVLGLRTVAPARPVGRYALMLARMPAAGDSAELALLPQAIAAAPDGRTVDSLLIAYAAAQVRTGFCEPAAQVYRAVRRRASGALADSADAGLVACASRLGERALADRDYIRAEQWLGQIVAVDSAAPAGRAALIGIARAREGEGDTLGAALILQLAVRLDSTGDSLGQAAGRELDRISAPPPAGDSVRMEQ